MITVFADNVEIPVNMVEFSDGVIVNLEQQKSPMGDVSKKSARGLLMVDSQFNLHQSCTAEEEQSGLLTLLYKDGKFHKEQSIWDIKGKYFK